MVEIETAASIFNVETKYLHRFNHGDMLNNNILEGFICTYPDHRFGAILIDSVNKAEVWPQAFYFNSKELLDRVYVHQYAYTDQHGDTYITFKSVNKPVLRRQEVKFVSEILEQFPLLLVLPDVERGNFTYAYELVDRTSYNIRLLYAVEQCSKKVETPNERIEDILE